MSIECIDSELFNNAKVEALQKAIAGLRGQLEDFRAENTEDFEDVKKRLWELQFLRRERA